MYFADWVTATTGGLKHLHLETVTHLKKVVFASQQQTTIMDTIMDCLLGHTCQELSRPSEFVLLIRLDFVLGRG